MSRRREREAMGTKPIMTVGLVAVLVAGVVLAGRITSSKWVPKAQGTATMVIQIEGMSCYACVARIKETLGSTKGVTAVAVSLQKREGEVQYQPAVTTPDHIVQVINGLGYRAKLVGGRSSR